MNKYHAYVEDFAKWMEKQYDCPKYLVYRLRSAISTTIPSDMVPVSSVSRQLSDDSVSASALAQRIYRAAHSGKIFALKKGNTIEVSRQDVISFLGVV